MARVEPSLIGRTLLGKLRVDRAIGEGGAGCVYEVEHLLTGHKRALKVVHAELCASTVAVARLLREAKAASRIRSQHVVETLDAGRLEDGRAYVLMELVEGRSLRALLDEGPLAHERAMALAVTLCRGLSAIHEAGLVHRDLKPENLMISGALATERVRILDFGICKIANDVGVLETLTRDGALIGTPAYMAPEQFDAHAAIDARTDLWALGAVLFEMLVGDRPFSAPTPAAMAALLHRTTAAPLTQLDPSIPRALASLVARLLARDPEARPASATEVELLLLELQGERFGGRYEIRSILGRGATGVVYEVMDTCTGEARALKVLSAAARAQPAAVERMRREALAARTADAEHVARLLESGTTSDGAPFLVLELCEGEALSHLIAREARMEAARVLAILAPLSASLDAIHAAGVVHRDVKPSNVIVSVGEDRVTVKWIDFGLAKLHLEDHGELTSSEAMLGTPLYMAPEQATRDGQVGGAADRYALAHVAFTMLSGRPYFAPDAEAGLLPLLGAIGRGVSESARVRATTVQLPRAFDDWFQHATALDPGARFATARAQCEALSAALGAESHPRRWGTTVATATAVALVVSVGLAWGFKHRPANATSVEGTTSSSLAFERAPTPAVEPSAVRTPAPPVSTLVPTREPAKPTPQEDHVRSSSKSHGSLRDDSVF